MGDYVRRGRLLAAVIADHPVLVSITFVGKTRITI
jgi:hypothetical protein